MNEYKEIQKFNSLLAWIFIYLAVTGIVSALIIPTPQANRIPVILLVSVLIILVVLFMTGYLKTAINQTGITIEMRILFKFGRTILWDDIQTIKVDKYRPIIEFGGWGYRIGHKAVAYNCRGNDGLIILLKNGRKVVLGTQKPEELKKFLVEIGKGS